METTMKATIVAALAAVTMASAMSAQAATRLAPLDAAKVFERAAQSSSD
jgi:hypothetical protein